VATVNKRYYWLKLPEDFFRQKEIKSLRKIAGGDTYTIIYQKMLLKSLSNNGVLYFDGIEDDFISELALDIDEDYENVAITVQYLRTKGILLELNEEEFLLTTCEEMVGSETASTRRSRKSRKAQNLLQCNNNATKCNGEIEKEIEKEIEIETEKETEKEKRVNYQLVADMYNDTCVSFPKVTKLSDKRKRVIKARLKTYSIEDFKTLFQKAEGSSFLKGANSRNWSASFDWLIEDANMAKVLDGNYDDRAKRSTAPKNSFNSFKGQRDYDFEELEKELFKNEPKTAGEDEAIRERAEALRQQLGGV